MVSPALICSVNEIDVLVTDSGITNDALGAFRANDIEVLAV
jgi:DeoR/GlpR family transcriptional regulator of sugar metabolism